MRDGGLVDILQTPPPWRSWPETIAVIDALKAEGGTARFVGGCVRDALLGLATEDIDIATDLLPGRVIQGLKRAGIKALPTGLDHGTITAVTGKRHFEITTLRVDLVGHGRHADIAFTHDWELDAGRRDFTFNALYLDPKGKLIDPVGGLKDLKVRHVCFIGNADDRIREDRLRVLRYFRFYARFGDNNPDKNALSACERAAGELGNLSAERVQKELLLLLGTKNPGPALELMEETGVLRAVTGPAHNLQRFKALLSLQVETDAVQRFAALMGGAGDEILDLAERLRLSNKQKLRLERMCDLDVTENMSKSERDEVLYHLGTEGFIDQTILLWAKLGPDHDLSDFLAQAATWRKPEFPVTGVDLLGHGFAEGEKLGTVLKAMEKRWVSSGFKISKADLFAEFLPNP